MNNRTITLPLSKSDALRAMALNAVSSYLGNGKIKHLTLPVSDDIEGMSRAVALYERQLVQMARSGDLTGTGTVHIGAGGAPFRFFTALAASTPGIDIAITADEALMRRPNGILIEALRDAGADIECLGKEGAPPIRIRGRRLTPRSINIDAATSSQFISALMMASPLWGDGMDIPFRREDCVSLPYLDMTAGVMRRFGCDVAINDNRITVAAGRCFSPEHYEVESDWSAASYFYESALLLPGKPIKISRLTPASRSIQGDSSCENIFQRLGVVTKYNSDGGAELYCSPDKLKAFVAENGCYVLNLNGTPDLVPALTVAFCLSGVKFRFEGIAHLRHKETDRMGALIAEMEKLGYVLHGDADTLSWEGEKCNPQDKLIKIATYSDHRMAMCMAPAAMLNPDIEICNPEVVNKSYPDFWENIKKISFTSTP